MADSDLMQDLLQEIRALKEILKAPVLTGSAEHGELRRKAIAAKRLIEIRRELEDSDAMRGM